MQKLITIQNGQAVTTDLLIAKAFNKRPSSVRRAIKNLNCNEEFRLHNFVHTSYIDQQGKKQPSYFITKDGFVLLVMGFTGKSAIEFKIQYIEAFNKMELYLNNNWTRLNACSGRFDLGKNNASECARGLAHWKYEKHQLESLIKKIKAALQLDLFENNDDEEA